MGTSISQEEESANQLEKELSQKAKDLKFTGINTLINAPKPTWQQVQSSLSIGEAAIEMIRVRYYQNTWTGKVLYLVLIHTAHTKHHPHCVILDNGNELESKQLLKDQQYYSQSRASIQLKPQANKALEVNQEIEERLYQLYWQPIQQVLHQENIHKVFLSVDGVYHSINLNIFRNPQTGKYILEELDIHLLGSTRDLITTSTSTKGRASSPSLMGGINYHQEAEKPTESIENKRVEESELEGGSRYFELDRNQIQSLPGTQEEVENIQALLKQKNINAQVFTGTKASKSQLMALQSPSILHIATHGFFKEDMESSTEEVKSIWGNLSKQSSLNPFQAAPASENPLFRSCLLFAGAGFAMDRIAKGLADQTQNNQKKNSR